MRPGRDRTVGVRTVGQLGYLIGENVNGQDVVAWYTSPTSTMCCRFIEFFGGGSYKWAGLFSALSLKRAT